MAAIVASLMVMRRRVVDRLSQPEAIAQWRAWRAETERQSELPGPVQRRAVVSDEPPALVLLRDRFGVIVATSVLIGTFLFAFLAFLGRGMIQDRARRTAANRDGICGEHRS